jgi:hypothetical protein
VIGDHVIRHARLLQKPDHDQFGTQLPRTVAGPVDVVRSVVEEWTLGRGEDDGAQIFVHVVVRQTEISSSILLVERLVLVEFQVVQTGGDFGARWRVRVKHVIVGVCQIRER